MTSALKESMNPFGLRILAEIPTYLSRRIAQQRDKLPGLPADSVAERIVGELNEGQRWAITVAAVAANVAAYDRATVRGIEKTAVRVKTGRPVSRLPDVAAVELVRQRLEVRELAEREAARMTVDLSRDLLDAPIKLGDGVEVRIGDATADQHAARIDMLEGHAQGATDTLARAIALLNLLRASGRSTLREAAS